MPIAMVEQVYQSVQYWNNADKMVLVEKIIHSVNNPPKRADNQSSLLSIWEDDRSADEIIQDIKGYPNDVVLEKDIDGYNSLDYLAVSDDKTDDNWLNNIFALSDKASKNIATHLPQNERGWTRDELYER